MLLSPIIAERERAAANGITIRATSTGRPTSGGKGSDGREGAMHAFPFSDSDNERAQEERSSEWLADLVERLNIVAERLTDLKQVHHQLS